jgi:hypothetical protein
MNLFNIENSFAQMKEKGWDKLYWFIDYHGTVAVADYGDENKKRRFFPHAREVLQILTNRPEICLVLWTCSYKDDISEMVAFLEENDIQFDYINENPECISNKHVDVSQKPYYNVMLDDRAGFEPEDWEDIQDVLLRHYFR